MTPILCVMLAAFVPMSVHRLDRMTAQTVIRLWHDLHVERKTPHDFQHFLARSDLSESVFIGGVVNNEIRSIVCTTEADEMTIHCVSCAPAHDIVGDALLERLARGTCAALVDGRPIVMEHRLRTLQPRWFIAYKYYANETFPVS